jgi:hypothetical protein
MPGSRFTATLLRQRDLQVVARHGFVSRMRFTSARPIAWIPSGVRLPARRSL